jgi:hypothetical protein
MVLFSIESALTKRGSGTVTLIVGNNVATIISEDAYTRVGRTKIDTNRGGHDGYLCVELRKKKGKEK